MCRYNNVEVSQYVLFDREKQLEIVFNQGKQNILRYLHQHNFRENLIILIVIQKTANDIENQMVSLITQGTMRFDLFLKQIQIELLTKI